MLVVLCRSGERTSDEVVLDQVFSIMRVMPETVEDQPDQHQPSGNSDQAYRPTLLDLTNIGCGKYFRLRREHELKEDDKCGFHLYFLTFTLV